MLTPTGEVLGTLCIVDDDRRSLSAEMLDALDELARRVAGELEIFGDTLADIGEASGGSSVTLDRTIDIAFSDPACAAFLLDAKRRAVRASEGMERLFGIAPESAIGATRDELVHPDPCGGSRS